MFSFRSKRSDGQLSPNVLIETMDFVLDSITLVTATVHRPILT